MIDSDRGIIWVKVKGEVQDVTVCSGGSRRPDEYLMPDGGRYGVRRFARQCSKEPRLKSGL